LRQSPFFIPTLLPDTVSKKKLLDMRFWIGVLAFAVLTFTVLTCELTPVVSSKSDPTSCGNQPWLQNLIESLKQNSVIKSEVILYHYKGESVYYVDACKGCADNLALVYNSRGEIVCQFGGIAGLHTCPDFFETAVRKKVIWKN
jgi:hypothetical protein